MKNKRILFLTQAAMIAALYVVFTLIAAALGLSSMQVQIRFSEALTILPYFTPSAIPGVFIGCLLSNILAGGALLDIIFGSLTTLAAAVGTYLLRRQKWLAPVPPIVANTLVIPFVIKAAYGIGPVWLSFITVGAGELLSAGVLGMLLLLALEKYRRQIFMAS
ncbi:MAG: QueT transporter family protein [Lachnospiraceae bacterium]|nr:QueT transporter family protein [Lachnospiraceae bacterium]MDE7238526.1 QueT transporter family protein [Lachnospiraceae bacterium]